MHSHLPAPDNMFFLPEKMHCNCPSRAPPPLCLLLIPRRSCFSLYAKFTEYSATRKLAALRREYCTVNETTTAPPPSQLRNLLLVVPAPRALEQRRRGRVDEAGRPLSGLRRNHGAIAHLLVNSCLDFILNIVLLTILLLLLVILKHPETFVSKTLM